MRDETTYLNEYGDFSFSPLIAPIYQTSAYLLPEGESFRYSREANPTVADLANYLAKLEHAESCSAFSSGMGAITTTLFHFLRPGDSVLIHADVFARTLKFLKDFLSQWGVTTTVSDSGTDSLLSSYRGQKVVFVETIANPTIRVHDLQRIRESIGTETVLIADSTFATPVNLNPCELGADVVIHSGSKFLAGHNDVISGFALGREKMIEQVEVLRRTVGDTMEPFTAFLVKRGMKTLDIRVKKSNASAQRIAESLLSLDQVHSVSYPGLKDFPDHEIAAKQMKGFGSVLSFTLKPNSVNRMLLLKSLKLARPANTLGGVNSTLSHPATMSHRSFTRAELKSAGFDENLYRVSVGIEAWEDLFEDLQRALKTSAVL